MEPEEGLVIKKDLERVEQTPGEQIDRAETTLSGKIDENSRKLDNLQIQCYIDHGKGMFPLEKGAWIKSNL